MSDINTFTIISVIAGIAYLIAGIILRLLPPRKINFWFGYRTPRSMSDKKIWNFSQKYAGRLLVILGIVSIVSGIIYTTLSSVHPVLELVIGLTWLFISVLFLIIKTESKISGKFNQ